MNRGRERTLYVLQREFPVLSLIFFHRGQVTQCLNIWYKREPPELMEIGARFSRVYASQKVPSSSSRRTVRWTICHPVMAKAVWWSLGYVQRNCWPRDATLGLCLFETAGWMPGPQREVMTRHEQFTHQHHPPDSTTPASWLPPLWIILLPGPPLYPSQGINSPGSNFTM